MLDDAVAGDQKRWASPEAASVGLGDGRRLAYAEYGDGAGRPMLFFHGLPSSRLWASVLSDAARSEGVRMLALDRPGFGCSSPDPDRSILDWSDDVAEFVELLGIDAFSVLSTSAGLPYALACTLRLRERVLGTAIASGAGPLDADGVTEGMRPAAKTIYALGLRSQRVARMWMAGIARMPPERVLGQQIRGLAPVDREILRRPELHAHRIADLREAFRQGAAGASVESALFVRDWGFELEEVDAPVHLWQGSEDRLHPPAMGRYLASALPQSCMHYIEGAGGMWFIDHMDVILAELFGLTSVGQAGARATTTSGPP